MKMLRIFLVLFAVGLFPATTIGWGGGKDICTTVTLTGDEENEVRDELRLKAKYVLASYIATNIFSISKLTLARFKKRINTYAKGGSKEDDPYHKGQGTGTIFAKLRSIVTSKAFGQAIQETVAQYLEGLYVAYGPVVKCDKDPFADTPCKGTIKICIPYQNFLKLKTAFKNPKLIIPKREIIKELARLLRMSEKDVEKELSSIFRYIYVSWKY